MVREAISIATTVVSAVGRPPTYGEIAVIGIDAGGSQAPHLEIPGSCRAKRTGRRAGRTTI